MREIIIHYDRCQINLGEAATTEDVDGWLDNLSALIAKEFSADVSMHSTGTWGGYSTCCRDEDVNERLREINGGDEWIALIPEAPDATDA